LPCGGGGVSNVFFVAAASVSPQSDGTTVTNNVSCVMNCQKSNLNRKGAKFAKGQLQQQQ
jgi:hypothetical protein